MYNIHLKKYFSSMVIARNLPIEWTAGDIVGNLNDNKVTKINFIKNKDGNKTGKAILHYKKKIDAENAIKLNSDRPFLNKRLQLDLYSGTKINQKYIGKSFAGRGFQGWIHRRVYFQNLSPEVTKDDIYALTKDLSDVQQIKFPLKENGENKGFSIVYLSDASHVANVLNSIHNRYLLGRRVKVTNKLSAVESDEENRLSDKLDYVKYLKRKYLATAKDVLPAFDHTPSLKVILDEKLENTSSEKERKNVIDKLMSLEDQTLEKATELVILEYKQIMFG